MADEQPSQTSAKPLVMDIKRPMATKQSVAPDHQLAEHGTPDAAEHDPVSTQALLDEVAIEHATVSSHTKLPVGLIVVTLTVLVILAAISWVALSAST